MSPTRDFREYIVEELKDPAKTESYLSAALDEFEKDGNREAFLLALRTVVQAHGGVSRLAAETGLNRQHLYRALSGRGNPTWTTLNCVLAALGFRFRIERREATT